jgi:phospholipid/cholesterol/gamma-HCH transport system substrate-binding protein
VSGPRRVLRRGIAVAALTALLGGCGFSLQSFPKIGGQGGPSYPIYAQFSNVLNLPANAQVRDGSAVIGTVTSISTHDFLADVTLAIRRGVRLPVGTTAQVRFDSPLGDLYILLTPPTTGHPASLPRGARLALASTSTAPSVEDTLTALGTVLNGGGINQLQTIVVELNKTFGGNQGQIRGLLSQLSVALKSLAAHTGDIDNAIAAVGKLAVELNDSRGTITTGIDAIAPAVTVLARENGDLHSLLTQLTRLSRATNAVIATSGQDSINDAHDLIPVINQLVGVERQVGPDLSDIATFEAMTPKIAPGDYLQLSVNLNADFNSNPVDADGPAATTTATTSRPARGSAAITELLEAGLP